MSNGNWNLREGGGDQLLTTTALTKQVRHMGSAERKCVPLTRATTLL